MKLSTRTLLLAAGFWATVCVAQETQTATKADKVPAVVATTSTDSLLLEKALQQLEWNQFKSVVEAIPKLKADVDAYGPLGWSFVQMNYTTYGWKKNIDKLDPEQKKNLADLIRRAREQNNS